jgi:hypothetical protein
MGIFRAFKQGEPPLYQLMGVPIPLRVDVDNATTSQISVNDGFLHELTWTKTSILGNENSTTFESIRISMFPSWSWAGWSSGVHNSFYVTIGTSEEPHIWIETTEGILPIPEDESLLKEFLRLLPRHIQFIHVEARMFTCSFRHHDRFNWLWVPLTTNPILGLRLVESLESDQTLERWPKPMIGILVGDTSGNSLDVAALIFRELDGYYERVACCSFSHGIHIEFKAELKSRRHNTSKAMMESFSRWIKEETMRKKIRIG